MNHSWGDSSDFFVYRSAAMEEVIEKARTVARFPTTILIEGESGTGKDLLAKFIHYSSKRYNQKFMVVNCATFQETLIDAELFGYEKGSFTGALTQGKVGLFEQASGGTVFLDEIAELPFNLQGKLLHVLQDKHVRRIGASINNPIDIRIIAATNKNLKDEVANATFREDLYYRLSAITILVPPLRERREDIEVLVNYYLEQLTLKYEVKRTISKEMLSILHEYNWPGNVRELINTMEQLVILAHNEEIAEPDFPPEILGYSRPTKHMQNDKSLKVQLDEYEKELIKNTLQKYKSIRRAAVVLGVSHTTLNRKIRKYNLIANEDTYLE